MPVDVKRAIHRAPRTRQRLLCGAVLGFLVLALVGSALAARKTGTTRSRSKAQSRLTVSTRTYAPLPPAVESLELPGAGLPAGNGGVPRLGVNAAAAILVDAQSGVVLYERHPDAPLPPASVTKILTALIILERGRLSDTVVVSQNAAQTGGHRLGLRAGQRISLADLLAAVLIRSANDAAVAAAEHVGGSLSGFVGLMNETAKDLGMASSRFANPHGLDEPFHFTTARDMATLTRVALDNTTFAELVRARQAHLTIWKPGRRNLVPQNRIVLSHNRLLGQVAGADGVKTGYTDSAGRCLVASASRGSHRMIAVLLNDPQRWTDAAALLEYGFGSVRDAARARPDGPSWLALHGEGWPRLDAQARPEERP
jgi:serine-type D-Ala-D-Ala carboxypeptidase (penicillin-binding protein 5/6)